MPMTTNFSRVGIYNNYTFSIKSPDPLITWSCKVTKKYFSCYITTTTRPIATKLCYVVTYYKKLQPNKTHNSLKT